MRDPGRGLIDPAPHLQDGPAAQTAGPPDAVVRIWPARVVVALAAMLPAAAAAILLDGGPFVLSVLGTWTAVALIRAAGTRRIVEHQQQLATDVRVTALFAGPIALAAIAGVLPLEAARISLVVVALAAASTRVVRRLAPRQLSARRVVLVGSQREVETYAAAGLGEDLVAGCLVRDGGAARSPTSLLPTTFTLDALPELVSRVRADAILVLPGVDVTATEVRDLTWLFEDSPVTVGIVCPVSSVSAHRLRTTTSGPTTVLELGKPRATAGARFAKALVDRSGAVVLLLTTSPLLLLLWAAVRLESTGPGFYVATRTGRDGERFQMVKLRTMHHDAGDLPDTLAGDEPFSISRDPRVTRVGYWLRRFSLDELPQLFNVLRGEMSLVGPRPALPDEVAAYDSVSRRRLVVKPGITGLWQVSGHHNLLWDESLRLDLYYADNWRLVDDLRIAARSVVGGTRARGAY
jgi:lipopolysaccharide/colanic/teichoic acid biosynthesis glycosyltransferase